MNLQALLRPLIACLAISCLGVAGPQVVSEPGAISPDQQHAWRQVLKRLKAVPAAYLEGRPALVKDRLTLARNDWKRLAPSILPSIPGEDRSAVESLMTKLEGSSGLGCARGALQAYGRLADHLPASWERHLRRADRDVMDTWLDAEEGRWADIPSLRDTLAELMRQGDEKQIKLMPLMRDNIEKAEAAIRAKDKGRTQLQCALLRRLLEELEAA